MESHISKSKIDRLGDRLRKGNTTDDDLRLLDEYRRSFTYAYDTVVGRIRQNLKIEPTGRPAKSTTSISEKLRRESIRLTQVQDISGCRLIVPEIAAQEKLVASLVEIFSESTVIDRREKPSHGYRAVHIIVWITQKAVEIQVRTALQQGWAELSEKLSDLIDPAIKYGGGEEDIKRILDMTSSQVDKLERLESSVLEMQSKLNKWLSDSNLTDTLRADIMDHGRKLASHQADLVAEKENQLNLLRKIIKELER
jgi:putative GTP pyrophosphokinase